jgi:phage tail-like protein
MPSGLRQLTDPLMNFRFCVEIDGVASAGFSEVDGLSVETDIVEYREGCDASTPRKMRGLTKYGDITLARGMTTDLDVWNLQTRVFDAFLGATGAASPLYRFDMYIIQRDMSGIDIRTWKVEKAWVSKYEIGTLSGDGNEVALETITVANEGWYLER